MLYVGQPTFRSVNRGKTRLCIERRNQVFAMADLVVSSGRQRRVDKLPFQILRQQKIPLASCQLLTRNPTSQKKCHVSPSNDGERLIRRYSHVAVVLVESGLNYIHTYRTIVASRSTIAHSSWCFECFESGRPDLVITVKSQFTGLNRQFISTDSRHH